MLRILGRVILLPGLMLASLVAKADGLPNIVIYLADDHSVADVGAYGSPDLHTPVLDGLAEEGMRFTNAVAAAAVCAPSRAAIYTGRYPHANGLHRNHGTGDASIKSMPHWLGELGYEVVLAGKVHVKPKSAYPFTYIERHEIPNWLAGAGEKPFALVIAYNMPHAPFLPKKGGYAPKKITLKPGLPDLKIVRQMQAGYYDLIDNLDHEVGAHQFWLQKYGFLNDALQVFASDQGFGFPIAKWTLYEEGLRVPLVVKWPGHVRPGTVSDRLVTLVDLLPTLIEAAGGTPDAGLDGTSFLPTLLGQDQEAQSHVFAAYSNLGVNSANRFPIRAVRGDRYKLIVNLAPENRITTKPLDGVETRVGVATQEVVRAWAILADGDEEARVGYERLYYRPYLELYDIQSDPHERQNLADDPEHKTRIERLYGLIGDWMQAQGDSELSALRENPFQ